MGHARKRMLSFFLTTGCNLHCSYCYTHNDMHSGQRLDSEFAFAAIDTFAREGFSDHLRFFGPGEPTTEFELMRSIVEYATSKRGQKPLVELQTNGVFSQQVADYLALNVEIVWVSCDGLPEMHDVYRRNHGGRATSSMVEKGIRRLTTSSPGMTGIRTTITNGNVTRQGEMLRYFRELGVKYVWADPLFPAIGEITESVDLDPLEMAEHFLSAQDVATELGMVYGSILTCNFDEEVVYQCRACLPAPHLTTDGFVSACDMALFGLDEGPMDAFIFGAWDEQRKGIVLFEDRVAALRSRSTANLTECEGCPALSHCAGYCLGEVVNETGRLFGRKPRTCDAIRFLYERMDLKSISYPFPHP